MKKWAVVIGAAVAGWLAWLLFRKAPPVPPGQGTLDISVEPSSLQPDIYIDGVFAGRAPLTRNTDPGDYMVSFSDVSGYTTPPPVVVTIVEGQTTPIVGIYELSVPFTEWRVTFTGIPSAPAGQWTYMSPAFNPLAPSWVGGTYLYGGDSLGIFLYPWDAKVGYGDPAWGGEGYLAALLIYSYDVGGVGYQGQILVASQKFTITGGITYTWNLGTGIVG